MRVVALALLAAALPAAAQAQSAPMHVSPEQAATALQNPLVQDGLARTLTQLAGIVLDTRVGALAAMTDPRDDVRPGDTLRDVTRRDDPDLERHLYESTRRGVAAAGAAAGGAVAESAEIGRTADRLKAALAPLVAALAPRDEGAPAR